MNSITKFRILRNSSQGSRLPFDLLDLIENELIESEEYLQKASREWVSKFISDVEDNKIYITADNLYPINNPVDGIIKSTILRDNQMAYAMALITLLDNSNILISSWYNLIKILIKDSRYDIANLLLNYSTVKKDILESIISFINFFARRIINKLYQKSHLERPMLMSPSKFLTKSKRINKRFDDINSALDAIEDNEKYYEIISKEPLMKTNTIEACPILVEEAINLSDLVESSLIEDDKIEDLKNLLSLPKARKRLYDELIFISISNKRGIKKLKDRDLLEDFERNELLEREERLKSNEKMHQYLRNVSSVYAREFPTNL